jgi:hypothetical protein
MPIGPGLCLDNDFSFESAKVDASFFPGIAPTINAPNASVYIHGLFGEMAEHNLGGAAFDLWVRFGAKWLVHCCSRFS